jgi:hypothetical protein
MNCKLCGEHLYRNITFYNLFKYHYYIHKECEEKVNRSKDYIVFPLLDKMVMYDYIFEERYEESDKDYLFFKYANILLEKALNNIEWSIIVFIDDSTDNETIILTTKLAEEKIIFISIFNENFL